MEAWHIVVGLNVIAYVFSAGVVWTKIKNLEDIVSNGLSEKVSEHGEQIAALEARLND